MTPWGEHLATGRRRFSSLWHADLTNPTDLARFRARLVVAIGLVGVTSTAGSMAGRIGAEGVHALQVGGPIVAVLLASTLWGLWRREKNTDSEFLVMIVGGDVLALFGVQASNGPGDVASTALALVIDTVLAALLLTRRRTVVAQGVATVVLLGYTLSLSGGDPTAKTDFGSAVGGLVVVLFTLRWMRDTAVAALIKARVGEVTDPLTGLANRRGLERLGAQRWQEKARQGQTVAALVVDVDHFKRINDTQGHAAGDEILRRLGDLLTRCLRADDVAVRLGGEEFLVLCSVPPGQARNVAERIRRTIELELAPITVSIGVHETLPDDADDVPGALWSTVDIADRALYEAKASGRNRVVTTGN